MEYVLITGGTSGIGYELARVFAQNGFGILIAASNSEKLSMVKNSLSEEFHTEVETYKKDLSKFGAAEELYKEITGGHSEISVLVNNAGYGLKGETQNIGIEEDRNMLILNMMTLAELTKLFLKDRYQKGSGKVLNVSSTGAFQPGPYTSSYFASKAFVLSYSRAVRYEAAKHGIQVCTLCPGATKTGFFQREGAKIPKGAMNPENVARHAYHSLMKNKSIFIPGWRNKLLCLLPSVIKMKFVAKMKQ